ncbi:aliphatic nitrilase [Novosphingobium sp. SG751A]|uniref:Nit6803 family nitrilase n=1 Tax=Novosphingobium sp. SG751A TaxID=2587000 RepID=UPI001552B8A8|nr:Nit6803 family nitrilase [Novosphingobium sp. SG751A]NOW47750.1 aliphatic nitrilase [Novosphingobium sp. SG751A]
MEENGYDKRVIRAAAVQIAPVLDHAGGTLERVLNAIAEGAGKGVQFMVFPETFLPYYPYFSFIDPPYRMGAKHLALYDQAVTVPGPVTQALSAAARRHAMVLVMGVNERDGGSLYNTQLIFDADGTLAHKRRKITPTYHERMVWGQGDGSGLRAVDTSVGRVGALACWEHYNPLARYALMADGEQIHASQFPGSLVGPIFHDQIEAAIRHHAAESACFVVNATGWLTEEQRTAIDPTGAHHKALSGGCCTAIISPEGQHVVPPMTQGEGLLIADCDLALVMKRKRMMDSVGHYARPELLRLHLDNRPAPALHLATTENQDDTDENSNDDRAVAVLRHSAV